MKLLYEEGEPEPSRVGDVYVAPTPVLTTWHYPDKRVLVNLTRNCNHAFHINEAIWMLRGENIPSVLDVFIHDFSSRFAEPNGRMHGAYGYRWKHQFGFNQLVAIAKLLIRDPTSRQAVIQMWSAEIDLEIPVKDKPCNTHLYFRIHKGGLHMTVCNRSNDIIWGLYGANAVHFSILQEYLAAIIGVHLGFMHTISNNFHAYQSIFNKLIRSAQIEWHDEEPMALINEDPAFFMQDVMNWDYGITTRGFKTRWFNEVAIPVTKAFLRKKDKKYTEMDLHLEEIEDANWYQGMRNWCHQGENYGRPSEVSI